jgi:hypothetical protein
MLRQRQLKQTGSIIAMSLIFILGLASPGYAEDGEQGNDSTPERIEVFKSDPIPFRLALSQRNNTAIYPLFTITNNSYEPKRKNFTPPVPDGKQDKNSPKGHSLFTASLLTLTALNIADYVSTVKALQLPGLKEGNPILRPFTKNILLFSAVKLGISALDFYLLKNIHKKNKTLGWVLSVAGNLAMSYIVSQNIRKIQSVRGY